MKQTPLLLKTPMVQAYIAGTKTQTRRIMKPQPPEEWLPTVGLYHPTMVDKHGEEYPGEEVFGAADEQFGLKCPYGGPGDVLWVKETWAASEHWDSDAGRTVRVISYKASDGRNPNFRAWKSSLFMSKADSRFSLPIVKVRVERLQEISEHDALEEGIFQDTETGFYGWPGRAPTFRTARDAYRALIESINGPEAWIRNDWYWVLEFERYKGQA